MRQLSREVYAYSKLTDFPNSFFYDKLQQYPQIAVTTDLRKAMHWHFIDYNVKDFRQVLDVIVPNWTTDQTKFQESVILSEFLRECIDNEDDQQVKDWLSGCKKNTNSILSSIILLEEANVSPSEMAFSKDKNVDLLIKAWNYLAEKEFSIKDFRDKINTFDKPEVCKKVLSELFNVDSIDTIVLHGFYYFTPIQERVIRSIEKAGIKVIYLIQYDERYPYVHEIWKQTYHTQYGFEAKEDWEVFEGTDKNVFGELFEGRTCKPTNNIKIRRYASVIEYVNGMRNAKKDKYSIYAADYNQANKILKEFFPEEYGERKLLSYPIGQFIYELNNMWDDDAHDIILTEDALMACFSSGWIAYHGKSAKNYMQDMKYILPYFHGCETINQWKERIKYLEQIHDDVIEPFTEYKKTGDRWQAVAGNPFLNFSIFAVPKERLTDILRMIEQLLDMAKSLFITDKAVTIQTHIQRLESILSRNEKSEEMYQEERGIVQEIFDKLNAPSNFTAMCFPGDIAMALGMYLDGSFEDEERRSRGAGMVYPLYQIDAAGVKNGSKVHICLCDVDRMPGKCKEYIWPLSETLIKKCYNNTKNDLLKILMHVMDSTPISNRYFFYSALTNADVTISWIDQMNGKPLAPSPYIRLLEKIAGIKVKKPSKWDVSKERVEQTPLAEPIFEHYVRVREDAPREVMMDYALCPMRYLLGYVLEQYPTYQTTFLQNYSINGLVAAVYFLMRDQGCSPEDVYNEVIKLFPHLRRVEKRQILDYLSIGKDRDNPDYNERSEMNDMYYTDERLKIKYPNKELRKVVDELYGMLLSPDGTTGMNVHKPARYMNACVFCQHEEYCKNAVHALDQEAYYD